MAARHDLIGQCGKKWEEVFWGELPNPIPCKCDLVCSKRKLHPPMDGTLEWDAAAKRYSGYCEECDKVCYFDNRTGCTAELSFAWGGMNYRAGEQSIGTVYFENPRTGETMVAASTHARTPTGWIRRTTTTYHETQLLEKKLQAQDYEKSTIAREQMQAMEEMREKLERANWRSESSESALAAAARAERAQREANEREEYGDSTPYRPKIQDDGARARLAKDLAEKAAAEMYANRRKWSGIDTGVHLDALHNDQRR